MTRGGGLSAAGHWSTIGHAGDEPPRLYHPDSNRYFPYRPREGSAGERTAGLDECGSIPRADALVAHGQRYDALSDLVDM